MVRKFPLFVCSLWNIVALWVGSGHSPTLLSIVHSVMVLGIRLFCPSSLKVVPLPCLISSASTHVLYQMPMYPSYLMSNFSQFIFFPLPLKFSHHYHDFFKWHKSLQESLLLVLFKVIWASWEAPHKPLQFKG